MIGCFRKRVILCSDLSGRPTFRDLLGRVRDMWRAAFLNQDVTLELVHPGRGPAHPEHWSNIPSFNFMDGSAHSLEIPGLASSSLQTSLWFSATPLNLHLIRREKELELVMYFRRSIFSPSRMCELLLAYRTLLEQLAAAPDDRLPAVSAGAGYWDQPPSDRGVAG